MEAVQFDEVSSRLCISGEMTIYQAVELKAAIIASIGDRSVAELDLAEVTELDTAGLQLLLSLQAAHTHMRLAAISIPVQTALELLRLTPAVLHSDGVSS